MEFSERSQIQQILICTYSEKMVHLESLENTWVELAAGMGMLDMGIRLLGTGSQSDTGNP